MAEYSSIEISGSDTDMPLNVARRVSLIRKHLPAGAREFLDCGCGAGGYVQALDGIPGLRTTGLEYDADKVCEARKRGLGPERVVQGDIQAMPWTDGQFDAVMLNEVLEHVPDHDQGLEEVFRVLKPGGRLIIFSPNRFYPFETHGVLTRNTNKRLPHYLPFIPWIPLRFGERFFVYPARNYWPQELRRLVRAHGFEVISTGYVWQTFENISGVQPGWMKRCARILRSISFALEKIPLLRCFGVSQLLVLERN